MAGLLGTIDKRIAELKREERKLVKARKCLNPAK